MTVPVDPRALTPAEAKTFASEADPEEIAEVLRALVANPDDQALAVLGSFLYAAHGQTMLKPLPSQLATRALLGVGARGVEVIAKALLAGERSIRYSSLALMVLWQVGRGRGLVDVGSERAGTELLDLVLPEGTQEAAERAMRDIFAEAIVNPSAFWLISQFLQGAAMPGLADEDDDAEARATELMGLFAEASIKLSRSVLDEFARLINAEEREEEYQQFLAAHPVLLDPLAAEIVPKQRLGLELATDYAVRSHDGRWVLVEIERPQDLLFTEGGDFRERFTHAFGQVLDFQHWVDDNVAYAQRRMRSITAPRGLLVMGLRSGLTAEMDAKLRRFADNSRRIDIATYDDLLARATSLYENLRHPS